MPTKNKFFVCFLFLIFPFIVSCGSSSYKEIMHNPEKEFYQGNYKEAAAMLLPHVNEKGKDQLLFLMECGYMLHAAGEFENSNKVLLKAAEMVEKKPISISKQVTSLLTNETSTNYRGEDFEKVLIHMYLGLNYLMLDKIEAAGVEFKAVNNELRRIKSSKKNSFYKQNIMAKYLTALVYEILAKENHDEDDLEFAYKEYEQIYKLKPSLKLVQIDLQRLSKKLNYLDDYQKWLNKFGKKDMIPVNAGELVVTYQAGLGAIKESRGSLLSNIEMKGAIYISLNNISLEAGVTMAAILATMKNAENPFPKFTKRSNKIKYLRLKVNNKRFRTVLLENIEKTAVKNLEEDYSYLKGKLAGSIVTKAVASVTAGVAAEKLAKKAGAGSFSGLIGLVAGAGTGAALFSQMKPDLRCWHTLPANLQFARIFLKPGTYNIIFEFVNSYNSIVRRELKKIKIEKNKKTFYNIRTLF